MKQKNHLSILECIYFFFIKNLNYRINGRWGTTKWWQKQYKTSTIDGVSNIKSSWLNAESYRLVKKKAFGNN